MKLGRSKRDAQSYNPKQPHPFQTIEDAGLGAMSSAAGSRTATGGAIASVAMTNRYQRTAGCGVPGCGKPRDDEIHASEE